LKPPLLLCNEYDCQHDIDRDGFTTQAVRGVARFRADVLATLQTTPDDYRRFLCMAVPRGFERQQLRVRARTDGATVDYQYTDRQVSHSLFAMGQVGNAQNDLGLTRLEAFASISQAVPSVVDALLGVISAIKEVAHLGAAAAAAGDVVPGIEVRITVRAWGGPLSRRADLLNLVDYVTFAKIPQLIDPSVVFSTTSCSQTFDLMGRFVEMTKMIQMGGISRAVAELLAYGLGKFPALTKEDDVVIPTAISKGAVVRVATAGNPAGAGPPQPDRRWPRSAPPLGDQTRGSHARTCVAAALSAWQDGPDVPPPLPANFSPNTTPTY
jgi:hypothetical protein